MSIPTPVVKIPNLPLGPIADEKGNATQAFLTFLQTLLSQLQLNFGAEGCVVPTQPTTNIATIQNNQNIQGQYTCQPGTILYVLNAADYTLDSVKIAVRNSNDYPSTAPLFKTVTLT